MELLHLNQQSRLKNQLDQGLSSVMDNSASRLKSEVGLNTFYRVDPIDIESSEKLVKRVVSHLRDLHYLNDGNKVPS